LSVSAKLFLDYSKNEGMIKIKRLAFFTILLTYLLIVFGGYVASSHSGLGCGPEWPKCNGEIVPVLKGATLIEYLHRVIGAILGLLTLWLFFKIIRMDAGVTALLVAFVMLSLLVIQVLFGAAVVLRDLPSLVITIHLLIAMIFLALLIWLWRYPYIQGESQVVYIPREHRRAVVRHFNILVGIILLTLAFGGYIKHESYGLACGWLGCRHQFFPTSTPEALQTLHRGFATVTAFYTLILTYWAFANKWGKAIRRRLLLCAVTVLLQIVLGIVVINTTIDLPWAVLHLAIGTALFAFVSEARIYVGNLSVKRGSSIQLNQTWQGRRRDLE
jgi:heme a synthase